MRGAARVGGGDRVRGVDAGWAPAACAVVRIKQSAATQGDVPKQRVVLHNRPGGQCFLALSKLLGRFPSSLRDGQHCKE
jgi:hypothetical protein